VNFSIFSSRKFFIGWIATSILPFLAFFGATETLLRYKVLPKDLFAKHRRFYETSKAEHLAFGDSHVAMGFSGVEPFVNMAFPGENLEIVAYKTLKYLERVPQVKQILLPADPNMLARSRVLQEADRSFKDYGHTLGFLSLQGKYQPFILGYWRVLILKGEFDEGTRIFQADGAQLARKTVQEQYFDTKYRLDFIKATAVRVAQHVPMERFELSKSARAFEDLLQKLQKRGIQTCWVSFPATSEYRKQSSEYLQFKKAFIYYLDLAQKYSAKYVNAWEYSDDLSMFTNMDHLSEKGAKSFSKDVVRRCFQSPTNRISAEPQLLKGESL
jgi:nitroreductase